MDAAVIKIKLLSWNLPGGLKTITYAQNSGFLDRYVNPGPPV